MRHSRIGRGTLPW